MARPGNNLYTNSVVALYVRMGKLLWFQPWREESDEWRRLRVWFPATIASHSREQITYSGSEGLMRRHDYTVDVMGGAPGANYSSDYKEFQGIMMPMTRRVCAYDAKGSKVPEPVLVSIDIADIEFS